MIYPAQKEKALSGARGRLGGILKVNSFQFSGRDHGGPLWGVAARVILFNIFFRLFQCVGDNLDIIVSPFVPTA